MNDVKTNILVIIAVILLVASALILKGCGGARVPGQQARAEGNYTPKTEDELKTEQDEVQALIAAKPDLVAEETYTESDEPAGNLRIVVQSSIDEEENKDIYLLDETGSNPRRLTDYASVESFPCITDDGNRVFFVSDRDGADRVNPFQVYTEIYVLDLATMEPTRLTYDDRMDYGLSASGDGARLVYMTQEMGQDGYENPQMIMMNGDGTGQKVIQDEALKNSLPKISGDGNWIVFNSYRHGSMDIFLTDYRNPDKPVTKNLTNSFVAEYYPAINRDGSVIVFEKILNGVQDETMYELYRIDPDGKNEMAITNDKFCDSFPTLTEDGKIVIFVSKRWDWDEDGHLNEALFMMNIDGTNLRKISKQAAYFDQPDV